MYEVLMCKPEYFDVVYSINPWMDTNIKCDKTKALVQWNTLYTVYQKEIGIKVHLLPQDPHLPDMVFTANGGFVHKKKAIPGTFKHSERQSETELFQKWFLENHYQVFNMEKGLSFEGSGDAIPYRDALFAGYFMRTDQAAHNIISTIMDIEVLSFRLNQPKFYHIDTVFFPLSNGFVIYYPDAFDDEGLKVLDYRIGKKKLIPVSQEEANVLACNGINIDDAVVMHILPDNRLKDILKENGLKLFEVDLGEFLKAGGSAKCMTLELDH